MKNSNALKIFGVMLMALFILSCDSEDTSYDIANYVSFEIDKSLGVQINDTETFVVKVYANQISNSDRTFGLEINSELTTADPSSYDVPLTVTIPQGENMGSFEVTVNDINLGDGVNLVLSLNTEDQNLFLGDDITLLLEQLCPAGLSKVKVDLVFDNYPEETAWQIYNSDTDEFVVGNLNFGEYENQTSASEIYCLETGNYTFLIYDSYGDGFCCDYGNGSYTLIIDGIIAGTGGNFTDVETIDFSI